VLIVVIICRIYFPTPKLNGSHTFSSHTPVVVDLVVSVQVF
jgi:hypothetical protein